MNKLTSASYHKAAAFRCLTSLGAKNANNLTYPNVSIRVKEGKEKGAVVLYVSGPDAVKLRAECAEMKTPIPVLDDKATRKAVIGPLPHSMSLEELTRLVQARIPRAKCELQYHKDTDVPRNSATVVVPFVDAHLFGSLEFLSEQDKALGRRPLSIRISKPPKVKFCWKCCSVGHLKGTCNAQERCGRCLQSGHRADTCTAASAVACALCKSSDHICVTCPQGRWTTEQVKSARPTTKPKSASVVVSPAAANSQVSSRSQVAAVSYAQVANMASPEDDIRAILRSIDQKLSVLPSLDSRISSLESQAASRAANVQTDITSQISTIMQPHLTNFDEIREGQDEIRTHLSSISRALTHLADKTKLPEIEALVSHLIVAPTTASTRTHPHKSTQRTSAAGSPNAKRKPEVKRDVLAARSPRGATAETPKPTSSTPKSSPASTSSSPFVLVTPIGSVALTASLSPAGAVETHTGASAMDETTDTIPSLSSASPANLSSARALNFSPNGSV